MVKREVNFGRRCHDTLLEIYFDAWPIKKNDKLFKNMATEGAAIRQFHDVVGAGRKVVAGAHLEALPGGGGLADVLADLLGGQPEGTHFRSQGGSGTHLTTHGTQLDCEKEKKVSGHYLPLPSLFL